MSPAEFARLAELLCGPFWRLELGPLIGRSRSQVWKYATGRAEIPLVVALALRATSMPPPDKTSE